MIVCPNCKIIEPDGTETCSNCGCSLTQPFKYKKEKKKNSIKKILFSTAAVVLGFILSVVALLPSKLDMFFDDPSDAYEFGYENPLLFLAIIVASFAALFAVLALALLFHYLYVTKRIRTRWIRYILYAFAAYPLYECSFGLLGINYGWIPIIVILIIVGFLSYKIAKKYSEKKS